MVSALLGTAIACCAGLNPCAATCTVHAPCVKLDNVKALVAACGGTATTGGPDAGTATTTAVVTGLPPAPAVRLTCTMSLPNAFTPSNRLLMAERMAFHACAVIGCPAVAGGRGGLGSGGMV